MAKNRTLTISELEQQGLDSHRPIWVLNSSADSILEAQGEVIISIPKGNGQPGFSTLRIEQTWLAQNITDDIPRHQLLRSSEFRDAVKQKLIQPITEEFAEELNNEEGAAEERANLEAIKRHIRQAGAARAISKNSEVVRADGVKDDDDEEMVRISSAKPAAPELSDSFKMWVDKMVREDDLKVMSAIKGKRKFKRIEVEHMVQRFANKPKTFEMLTANLNAKKKK